MSHRVSRQLWASVKSKWIGWFFAHFIRGILTLNYQAGRRGGEETKRQESGLGAMEDVVSAAREERAGGESVESPSADDDALDQALKLLQVRLNFV